jgi:hypothetical protein
VRALPACALACAIGFLAASGAAAPAPAAPAPAPAAPAPAPAAPALAAPHADRAREQARDILAERRFRSTSVPAPLRGLRERIGASLRPLARPFRAAFDWVAGWLPGGPPVLWTLIAAALLGAAAVLAARAGARHLADPGAGAAGGGAERLSAARLRQEAEAAERRGQLDAALRLRFRAGLVDLDSRELIELRPALTDRELLRAVPSPTLSDLVDGFEAVVYGGRPAAAEDLRRARDGWPRVTDEARAR